MKAFFENPELLFGLPLLLLGLLGMAVAFGAIAAPQKAAPGSAVTHRGHPDDAEYIKIGITLAVITAVEVALFYIDVERNLLLGLLVVLSAIKFFIVVSWFMHLKFDSGLFTTAFVTGLFLAGAVFTVVLATLGSNFV
jgi:cytochrome c oxidase subunit 4